jgi:hypothetical protein
MLFELMPAQATVIGRHAQAIHPRMGGVKASGCSYWYSVTPGCAIRYLRESHYPNRSRRGIYVRRISRLRERGWRKHGLRLRFKRNARVLASGFQSSGPFQWTWLLSLLVHRVQPCHVVSCILDILG